MEKNNQIKERIYKFFTEHVGEKYYLKEAASKIKISYPTFQKWIYVIIEEKRSPKIFIEDRGRTKFVWAEEKI